MGFFKGTVLCYRPAEPVSFETVPRAIWYVKVAVQIDMPSHSLPKTFLGRVWNVGGGGFWIHLLSRNICNLRLKHLACIGKIMAIFSFSGLQDDGCCQRENIPAAT